MRTPDQERYTNLLAQSVRDFSRAELTARDLLEHQTKMSGIRSGPLMYLIVLLDRHKRECATNVPKIATSGARR
jgi:hypothetical protein